MSDFKPSESQKRIFDFIEKGVGNAVINAKAGSGKTTTAVKALDLIPADKKVAYIAFNRSIVAELRDKVKRKENTFIMTYHSLGLSILKENLKDGFELNEYKYPSYIKSRIFSLSGYDEESMPKRKFSTYIENVISLVNFSRYNLAQSVEEIFGIAENYGINIISNECQVAEKVLRWGSSDTRTIDYTDMIWLPCELGMATKKNRFDWIFIDEAQDSSIMEQSMLKKCRKRGSRFVAIGDEKQCINAFAGSNPEAFRKFLSEPHTVQLDLSISYRCAKNIVMAAREYVPDIEWAPWAEEGEIMRDVSPYSPVSGDMVLCRNTAPLVQLYFNYLTVNKKAYMKGGDMGKSLLSIAQSVNRDRLSADLTEDGVFTRLYVRLFAEVEAIMKNSKVDEKDAILNKTILSKYDAIKSLETIATGLTTKKELIDKINAIFLESDGEGVCLSTVHKAKGLEAENVYILCPSLMPSSYAVKQWEKEAEDNLIYVAITRAKKRLCYISEKEFRPGGAYDDPDRFISEMLSKRARAYSAVNKDISSIDRIKERNRTIAEDIREMTTLTAIGSDIKPKVSEFRKKKIGGNRISKFMK